MKVTQVDENEYKMRNCWPKGVYPCEVVKAEEGTSQRTGDPLFKCTVKIFNENGNPKLITTYVMAAGKAAWQLRSAVEAFGLLDQYHSGEVHANDLTGKTAYAKVGVEEDENGVYEPKNIIREFTNKAPKAKETIPHAGHPANAPIDDGIPF